MDQRNSQTQRQARGTQEEPFPAAEGGRNRKTAVLRPRKEARRGQQGKGQLRSRVQEHQRQTGSTQGRNRKRQAGHQGQGNREQGVKPEAAEKQGENTDEPEAAGAAEERAGQGLQEARAVHCAAQEDQHAPANRQQPRLHPQGLLAGHRQV